MTPYLRLQLGYLLLAGVLSTLAWLGLGRSGRLARRPFERLSLALLGLGLVLACGALLAKGLDHSHSTYQFVFIALGYYAAALWLPLLVVVEARVRLERAEPAGWAALLVASVLALGGAYALFIEPNRLVTTETTLEFEDWQADGSALRVVHVSDLQSVGACARERRAVERILDLRPDLIVVTGDYAAGPHGSGSDPAFEAAREFLAALSAPLGVVVVAGHSESESTRARIFEGLDLIYLRDEELSLELAPGVGARSLRLIGLRAKQPDLERFEWRERAGEVTMVISHVPDVSAQLDGRSVDLHLAGHTHGGQIAFPFVGPPMTLSGLPRRFARGLNRFGDHWLHVSAGIGMEGHHAPRVRFLCPPSIDLLLLAGSAQRGSSRSKP